MDDVEIEYVEPSLEDLGLKEDDEFGKIFARFALPTAADESAVMSGDEERREEDPMVSKKSAEDKPEWLRGDDSDYGGDEEEGAYGDGGSDLESTEARPVSKKKLRRMARYTVAQLKALVSKPECVEVLL